MAIKSFSEVVESIMAYIQATHPSANLTVGTLQRDALIDAPASELSELYGEVRIAQEAQSARDASGTHLDRLLANWAIYRRPGTWATGAVWFQRSTAPTVDIVIPAGTRIHTTTTISQDAIEFVTTQTVTMLVAQAVSYYNADEELYEIEAPIEAAYSGSDGNVGPNTITAFTGTADISTCTNRSATTGGSNYELDSILRTRSLSILAGINAGTKDGYDVLVAGHTGVDQVLVVGPNDDDMERVKDGGGADVWIKTDDFTEAIESYTYPSGETSYSLSFGPVSSVSLVRENGVLLVPAVDYNLALDSGVYGRSVHSNDRINWVTSRTVGSTIEIYYSWSGIIQAIQDLLDTDENHHVGADILVKLSYSATVDVTMEVEVLSGYNPTEVTSTVNTSVAAYIDALGLGDEVQQSDIIALAEATEGVDSVVLPLATFQITRELSGVIDGPDNVEGVVTGSSTGNLITRRFEYPEAGTIQINYYT